MKLTVLSLLWLVGLAVSGMASQAVEKAPRIEPDGTIHIPAFDLPESAFLSEESRAVLKQLRDIILPDLMATYEECAPYKGGMPFDGVAVTDIPAIRQCRANLFYQSLIYKSFHKRYDVKMTPRTIAGVYTEVFTPKEDVAAKNKSRVLINLHGGGMMHGSRTGSHAESMPIAAIGGIKVISIDYRMAPEHQFPAASQDVTAVYRHLLKDYKPENIGIYSCSAGGMLTADAIAWFQQQDLPMPGAAGIFCAGAMTAADNGTFNSEINYQSDSYVVGTKIAGYDPVSVMGRPHPYYKRITVPSPVNSPGSFDDVMDGFQPSLFIVGMRDYLLSNAVYTHAQLTRLGVEADLHIWEGMEHGFHVLSPDLPESREAYNVIVKFFDKYLGY